MDGTYKATGHARDLDLPLTDNSIKTIAQICSSHRDRPRERKFGWAGLGHF